VKKLQRDESLLIILHAFISCYVISIFSFRSCIHQVRKTDFIFMELLISPRLAP
jgi:hypothetical protein